MSEKKVGRSGILSRPLLDAGGSMSFLLNVNMMETEKKKLGGSNAGKVAEKLLTVALGGTALPTGV